MRPYKKQFTLGPLAKLAEAVFELLMPLLMARLTDVGIANRDSGYILRMSLCMAGIACAGFACSLFCQHSASIASQGFGTALRNALYTRINALSRKDAEAFGTDTLVNRQTADVTQLQVAVAMLIRLVIRAPFLCIGGLVMAMVVDVKLSLVLLVFLPLFGAAVFAIAGKAAPLYGKAQKLLDRLSAVLRENLHGVRVVRAFGRTESEVNRFGEANSAQADAAMKAGRLSALLSPVTLLVMNAAILCVVWFGGFRVESGGLTQGELIAFISYVTQITIALVVVSNLAVLFTRAAASAARVAEVLETEPSLRGGDVTDMRENMPVIAFDNVSFQYNSGGEQALTDVSFRVAQGQTLGIVGGTGAGKSTMAGLLLRFDDVTAGAIRVGGADIREWDLDALRARIGYVPQKALLFTGSIGGNIRHGKLDATDEAVQHAAEIAQAAEFIDRFGGLSAEVQQKGRNLSGGQRQRVTIARALVRRPDILILDDSASALDYLTDARLRAALKTLQTKATVIISQRVSAVMDADNILVLDGGAAVGFGAHDALLRDNAVYREICLSQGIGEGAGA